MRLEEAEALVLDVLRKRLEADPGGAVVGRGFNIKNIATHAGLGRAGARSVTKRLVTKGKIKEWRVPSVGRFYTFHPDETALQCDVPGHAHDGQCSDEKGK